MNVSCRVLAVAAAAVLLAGCGTTSYNAPYGGSTSSSPGAPAAAASLSVSEGHLVGAGGKALYLWVKDMGTMSMCTGGCAGGWPPFTAATAPKVSAPLVQSKVGLSKRSDGTEQVTYAGHPLYYFAGDAGADDTYGQGNNGFGGTWWLVSPAGSAITTTTSSSSSSVGGGYSY